MQAALVSEEEICRLIVGDEQVEPSVAIEVGGDDTQAPTVRVDNPRLGRHVGEPAAVVAEQVVRQRRRILRGAVGVGTVLVAAEIRLLEIPKQVMADVEVKVAVAVEVGECGRGGPVAVPAEPILCGDVLECPIPLVAVERVPMPAGDEEVRAAVVVDVADGHAMAIAPRERGEPGRRGRVLERPIAPLWKSRSPSV